MSRSDLGTASDYNPRRPAPGQGALAAPLRAVLTWTTDPRRRDWAVPLAWGAVGLALLLPLDGAVTRAAVALNEPGSSLRIGGDVRRELEALQQYGQLAVSLLVAWAIWLADPARRRRLLDWAVAYLLTAAAVFPMKMLVGRVRPGRLGALNDPWEFLGPFGAYPLGPVRGVHHAWELWAPISSDLWSMPSSHTAYAAVMSVVLATLYPRLRPLAIGLLVVVGACRVLFVGHYASDVAVGAAIGAAAGRVAMTRAWGSRRGAAGDAHRPPTPG